MSTALITLPSMTTSGAEANVESGYPSSILSVRAEYVDEYPNDVELIDNVIEDIFDDPQFTAIYDCDEEEAADTLRDALDRSIQSECGIQPQSYVGTYASSKYYVPVVKQKTNYYCGPASIIEALVGNGILDDENSVTQGTIAAKAGTTSNGTYVYKVRDVLNSYYSSSPYEYKYVSHYTSKDSVYLLVDSLANDFVPVVLFSNTSKLGYYNGKAYSHYVAVEYVDLNAKKIGIVDPNYISPYGGEHEVSFDSFSKALDSEGWIISFSPPDKPNEDK